MRHIIKATTSRRDPLRMKRTAQKPYLQARNHALRDNPTAEASTHNKGSPSYSAGAKHTLSTPSSQDCGHSRL